MKEEISALVDGESQAIERERLFRALDADPVLRQTWERYHLAGSALRRDLDMVLDPGLSGRIQASLANETPDRTLFRFSPGRVGRIAAGMAIAASVAAVAILNLSPELAPSALSIAKNPVSAPKTSVAQTRALPPEQQRALGPYLVHHGEIAPAAGLNGMLPYVRVVSHDGTVVDGNKSE